ncbi:flagellar basal body-associated protein FliL [Rhodoferax sp. PAMC 29310]|uniref:flagellar basal body-associated FliL family protein n=1 Tax=Rhodoferax sp. PAMC 29310 TaxID=2822760 RepID=UPI001F0B175B|nr:flagellar basal body-associated FliL family protein [Rhodoferax sp. PAMC 29310]
MAEKPGNSDTVKAPAKSKKMLIVILGVVLVLVLGGGGAFFYISKQRAAAYDEEGGAPAKAVEAAHKTPPVYLPLDNMVVNLANPGGDRVAQVGITLEVRDAKASDSVKVYLPAIRSGILLIISQRTAEQLLSPEGKVGLAKAIVKEASIPFGGGQEVEEEEAPVSKKTKSKRAPVVEYPVVAVLFSSFIVQ